jgi:hypothetical protein
MCNYVSTSVELQMGHVLDGKASLPKKSCFLAWPIYKHFFCLSVMAGFLQKSFDNTLSMSSFSSHLCSWCV